MESEIQAIFMDRDGTIGGSDLVEYPGNFELFPFAQGSINSLKDAGISLFSFTNQPGISRGEVRLGDFENELLSFGFDKVYLCPHSHTEGCQCRKPAIGMLKRASDENSLDLNNCAVIGDRWTDLVAANKAGCIKILVKTGAGKTTFEKYQNNEYWGNWGKVTPDYVAENVRDAVDWLLNL